MRILALEIERPGTAAADFQPHLADEARAVWTLVQEDVIREVYFRADRQAAVLILECADVAEARHRLASLPLAVAGLIEFEFIPLVPYPGLARLFSGPGGAR
jgi:hypothetical protein